MSGVLSYLSKVLSRRTFRVLPPNIIKSTASQIHGTHKKIYNEYSSSCNVSTSKVEMVNICPDAFKIGPEILPRPREDLTIIPPTTRKTDILIAPTKFPDNSCSGIVTWYKTKNATVDANEFILRIETDKTFMFVPAPTAGTIVHPLVRDGDRIAPGQCILAFGRKKKIKSRKSKDKQSSKNPTTNKDTPPSRDPITISPEHQPRSMKSYNPLTLPQMVTSNRPNYRINFNNSGRKDISQLMGPAIGARDMLTTINEIDMGNIIQWRKQKLKAFQDKYGTKFGFMAVFCKACASALKELPRCNAFIDGNDIVYHSYADISVAVPSPNGYILPVLRNVEQMNCADIAKNIETLASKNQRGFLQPEEENGGTFTITNAGKFGALMGTPIITPPKSTVLGMHGIVDRPVAYKGKIEIRPMMYVALTYEPRLIDGHEASLFLNRIKESVEEPDSIVGCTEL